MHHHLARISKTDNDFAKKFDLGTFTKWKKRIPLTLVFLAMKIKKNTQSMYQKYVVKKTC